MKTLLGLATFITLASAFEAPFGYVNGHSMATMQRGPRGRGAGGFGPRGFGNNAAGESAPDSGTGSFFSGNLTPESIARTTPSSSVTVDLPIGGPGPEDDFRTFAHRAPQGPPSPGEDGPTDGEGPLELLGPMDLFSQGYQARTMGTLQATPPHGAPHETHWGDADDSHVHPGPYDRAGVDLEAIFATFGIDPSYRTLAHTHTQHSVV